MKNVRVAMVLAGLWNGIFAAGASGSVITVNTETGTTIVDTGSVDVSLGEGSQANFIYTKAQQLSKSGEPQIPWKMMTVLLPPNADMETVSCRMVSAEYETLVGAWDVAPAPPILTRDADGNEIKVWPLDKTIVDGCDTAIYFANALWPDVVQLTGTGKLRGWKLAEIAVPLVRYNPVSGELQQLVRVEISVDSDKKGKSSKVTASSRNPKTGKQRGHDRAKKLTVNFDDAVSVYEAGGDGTETIQQVAPADDGGILPLSSSGTSGYVVITSNDIRNNSTKLAAFVAHKQAMGFMVTVIDEDDLWGAGTPVAGDASATKLREWLQANYIALDLKYALIIGDPRMDQGYVPMKLYPCDGKNIPTDYFYAELTCDWDSDNDGIIGEAGEIERYFEVYVGRIPYYGTIADTDAILQKTIDYETSADTAWRRKTLISNVPLDESMHCYNWGEQIKDDILEPNAVSSDRVYRNDYGHVVTEYDILPPPEFPASSSPATVWSQGQYGLHVWSTHGLQTSASEIMTSSDAANLDDSHPSTVFQGSCRNAWPENLGNLSYSLLKNGTIVSLGSTRDSWYKYETDFSNTPTDAGLSYRYAKGIVEGKSCGEALWGLKEEISSWWTSNWTLFNPYGDPSVVVMPEPPTFTITPTDAFCSKQYVEETLVHPEDRTYTLANNSGSALNWTANKIASWFDLSSYSGSIPANSSVTIEISFNSGIESLEEGTHSDTITFTDTTNGETLLRNVDFLLLSRIPRTEYEAEDAVWSGPTFANNQAGYSGAGFLDYANASGDYIEWTINAASDGPCTLEFRYALQSGERPLELKVDGDVVEASLSFPSTGNWSAWKTTAEVVVNLTAGSHTVRLTAIGDSGGNIDLLRVYDGLNIVDGDAYVRGASHWFDNYGSATTLEVKYEPADNSYTRESYLRFNYADVTNSIESASLILTPSYLQPGGDTTVLSVRLLDDTEDAWDEYEITSGNCPSATGQEVSFTKGALQLGVPYSIDVTSLLSQTINSNKVASFKIVSDGAYHIKFHSREGLDPAERPALEIQVVDSDMDGMPDLWEEQYFANGIAALPGGHADGDGYSNLEEYIAGTDPTNAASFFRMEGFSLSDASGFVVEWSPSVTDRLYRVNWAVSMTNTFVPLLPVDIESPVNSYTDTVHQSEAQGFYRVDVRLK